MSYPPPWADYSASHAANVPCTEPLLSVSHGGSVKPMETPPKAKIARLAISYFIAAGTIGVVTMIYGIVKHPAPASGVRAQPYVDIRYVAMNAPCSLERSARAMMVEAVRTGDTEALAGLIERGRLARLLAGTKFEVSDPVPDDYGLVWGFVRSGREIGRDCYMVPGWLRSTP